MTTELEKCESCGRAIGANEVPMVWQGAVVCSQCRERLEAGAIAMPGESLVARIMGTYRRRPIMMAITTGAAAAILLLLLAVLVVWLSWLSGQTLRGIKAGIQKAGRAVAIVLPEPSGSIHGRIWWRDAIGTMHLGRDKTVWLIRRTVPRAAVLAVFTQPKLHAALTARTSMLKAAYGKAVAELEADNKACERPQAAYEKARAALERAQAAWERALAAYNRAGAPYAHNRASAAWEKAQAAHNRAWAAYNRARAAKNAAWTPYNRAQAAAKNAERAARRARRPYDDVLILGHIPVRMGTASAITILKAFAYHNDGNGVWTLKAMKEFKAWGGKTKADFKGRYHFSDIRPGRYFFIISASTMVDYGHPITVAGGKNIRVDINTHGTP